MPSSTATVTATSVQDTTKNGSASISLTGSTPPPPVAATPTFSPVGGTYSAAQSVAISSTTSGASIYYTNDGSIPTTSSTPYTSPVIVGASMTLNAIATATGFTNSQVGTATYTISVAPTNPVFVKITTATTTKPSYTCTPGDFLFLGANNNGVGTANAFLSISSSTDTFTQLGKNVGGVWHSQMSAWTGVCGGTGTRTVTFTASILGQIGVVVAEFKGPSTALSNAGNEQYYTGSYPVSGTNPQGTTLDIFISGNPNGFTTSSCAPAIHAGGVSAVADLWYAITPVGSNYSCSFTSSSNAAYVGTIFGAFR